MIINRHDVTVQLEGTGMSPFAGLSLQFKKVDHHDENTIIFNSNGCSR